MSIEYRAKYDDAVLYQGEELAAAEEMAAGPWGWVEQRHVGEWTLLDAVTTVTIDNRFIHDASVAIAKLSAETETPATRDAIRVLSRMIESAGPTAARDAEWLQLALAWLEQRGETEIASVARRNLSNSVRAVVATVAQIRPTLARELERAVSTR